MINIYTYFINRDLFVTLNLQKGVVWNTIIDPEKATSEFQVTNAISKLREITNQCIRTFTIETREFVEKMCKENEGDKVQIVKDYEQKYKPVMEALQKEIVHATRASPKI